MRSTLVIGIALSLLIVAPSPAGAEEIALSAERVTELVLERNYGVKRAEVDREAAATYVPEAKGVFDTNLALQLQHQIDKFKRTSPLFGTRTDTTIWNVGFTKELPSGTELGLTFDNTREKTFGSNVGGVPVIPAAPLYEPIIGFSLNQPLMQNLFGMNDRAGVREAEFFSGAVDEEVLRRIQVEVRRTLLDYWTYVFNRQHIASQERSVRVARDFLHATRERAKLGIAEETDVLAAEANLIGRQNELRALQEMDRTYAEALRRDLELDPGVALRATEKAPALAGTGPVDEARLGRALEHRGDYQAALRDLERRRVKLAVARNKRWPMLDVYSTLELNDIDPSYWTAAGDMDSPNWTVGMSFSVPLENRAARAGARRAEAEKLGAIYALKDVENQVVNEVTTAAEELGTRIVIVEAARRRRELQNKKLSLEMQKYGQGRSSSEMIVLYQDDVVRSDIALVEAWTAYTTSLLDLQLAEGTLARSALRNDSSASRNHADASAETRD